MDCEKGLGFGIRDLDLGSGLGVMQNFLFQTF